MNTQCEKCHKVFDVVRDDIQRIKDDDIEVEYFSCPYCHTKWQVLTTNSEFRELIKKASTLMSQIKLARKNHFRPATIRDHIKKYEKIHQKQLKLKDGLKGIGEEILGNNVESEKNEGQNDDTGETEEISISKGTDQTD